MSEKPKLFVLCGVPGSGKTTFAKKFADGHGLQCLGVDDFYALFNGDETRHTNKFEIWMTIFRALHMAELDRRSVVFDTNAPSYADRTQLLDWFPDFEHHLICIMAPEKLCRMNNASRRRVIPDDILEHFFRTFQMPLPNEDSRWKSIQFFENRNNNGFFLKESSAL